MIAFLNRVVAFLNSMHYCTEGLLKYLFTSPHPHWTAHYLRDHFNMDHFSVPIDV